MCYPQSMTLTEEHITKLISYGFYLIVFGYWWSCANPELAADVMKKFIRVFTKPVDLVHRILDQFKKEG